MIQNTEEIVEEEESVWQSTSQLPILMLASQKSNDYRSHKSHQISFIQTMNQSLQFWQIIILYPIDQ